jgi:hypothetical protein
MKFYFYLYGKKTGQVKILTRRINSKSETSVFKQYGNHGHRWNFAQVFLDFSPLDTFQVNFTNFLFFLVFMISCLFLQMIPNFFPDVRTNCSLYWPRTNSRWLFCFIHYSKLSSVSEKAKSWKLL